VTNADAADQRLLDVRSLSTYFHTDEGIGRAVDGVSFHVDTGETLALVGESGCGKSVTSLSIMRLVPVPGRVEAGEVLFDGRDLLKLAEKEMRHVRGRRIAMIFQEPMTCLNPVFTIGSQIVEAIQLHKPQPRKAARAHAVELLELVGMPEPSRRFRDYPHQLSGGMRQRVMIAMALSTSPELLIADEPTTALDVTIQAQILELLEDLRRKLGMSMILITHDLAVAAQVADRIAVMYAGRIVETAGVRELFANPRHPYTRGLFRAIPRTDAGDAKLSPIEGTVPLAFAWPDGCRFNPRCSFAEDICRHEEPILRQVKAGHHSACHFAERLPEFRR